MKATQREVLIKADQMLFVHAMHCKIICWDTAYSLADRNDTMRKSTNMLWHLEKQVSPACVIPKPSACISDAMALLHKTSGENKTFEYLTEIISYQP